MWRLRTLIVAALMLASVAARGDTTLLRIAVLAPDGTSWARDAKAWARDVESASSGRLRVHLYFGAIAGDDVEVERRMQREQLDGALSGGILCQNVAPSLRVMRIPGLIQDSNEGSFVLTRLLQTLRGEARARGFTLLAFTWLGRDVVLSRRPIDSMDALRRLRLWQWSLEPALIAYSRAMGLDVVPLAIGDAGRAYEDGRIDGFVAIPAAILGFQWYARRMYLSRLPFSPVIACLVTSAASFDRLPTDLRDALAGESAKSALRFSETARMQEQQLLDRGLFVKQGMTLTPVPMLLRAQFLDAARDARDKLGSRVVPDELVMKVQAWLADYRSEHAAAR
jgi:TRAP-type C4-dicarboxylate transport system substrate-binding protein